MKPETAKHILDLWEQLDSRPDMIVEHIRQNNPSAGPELSRSILHHDKVRVVSKIRSALFAAMPELVPMLHVAARGNSK